MTVVVLSRWLLQFNQLQINFNGLGAGQFVDFIEILTRERNET